MEGPAAWQTRAVASPCGPWVWWIARAQAIAQWLAAYAASTVMTVSQGLIRPRHRRERAGLPVDKIPCIIVGDRHYPIA